MISAFSALQRFDLSFSPFIASLAPQMAYGRPPTAVTSNRGTLIQSKGNICGEMFSPPIICVRAAPRAASTGITEILRADAGPRPSSFQQNRCPTSAPRHARWTGFRYSPFALRHSLLATPSRGYNHPGGSAAPGGEMVSTGQVDGKVACRGCQVASLKTWQIAKWQHLRPCCLTRAARRAADAC